MLYFVIPTFQFLTETLVYRTKSNCPSLQIFIIYLDRCCTAIRYSEMMKCRETKPQELWNTGIKSQESNFLRVHVTHFFSWSKCVKSWGISISGAKLIGELPNKQAKVKASLHLFPFGSFSALMLAREK